MGLSRRVIREAQGFNPCRDDLCPGSALTSSQIRHRAKWHLYGLPDRYVRYTKKPGRAIP
jgi:hypothetical protein